MVVELNKVEDLFKKCVENSDNKVQIAMQMYEMVSRGLYIHSYKRLEVRGYVAIKGRR